MLRVKTILSKSTINGIGLFADQFIPKGTVTWEFEEKFDTTFLEEDIESLPDFAQKNFLKYAYYDFDLNKYVLCADDQRFINHSSDNFNILSKPRVDVAARDIKQGEELLCDYTQYEQNWFERRGLKKSDFK